MAEWVNPEARWHERRATHLDSVDLAVVHRIVREVVEGRPRSVPQASAPA